MKRFGMRRGGSSVAVIYQINQRNKAIYYRRGVERKPLSFFKSYACRIEGYLFGLRMDSGFSLVWWFSVAREVYSNGVTSHWHLRKSKVLVTHIISGI